jgi:hypothetical protein
MVIDGMNIYPNPASDQLNIAITISDADNQPVVIQLIKFSRTNYGE